MKPHELKSPFKWKDRKVLIHDRVWYVPDQYEDFASFSFPGWSDPLIFDQAKPVCLEYCSGNGSWIAEKAQAYPEFNWVAIERKFERVRRIWSKVKNFNLSNLLTVCGEGHRMTRHYVPDASVQAVYINFPDPWPKTRHRKNRIVQVPFVNEVFRILQPGGVLTMVTDDAPYSQWMINILRKSPGFESEFPEPYFISEYPSYGTSFFEDLWRQKGKTIHYHAFRKTELPQKPQNSPQSTQSSQRYDEF